MNSGYMVYGHVVCSGKKGHLDIVQANIGWKGIKRKQDGREKMDLLHYLLYHFDL